MGYVEELRKTREGWTVLFTDFSREYKKNSNICYGFVEGNDDPLYYRNTINDKISGKGTIRLYPSGGKEIVKKIYDKVHAGNFENSQIVYFIDRDLSLIIQDPNIIYDKYVYITDKYSIENDFLNSDTLVIVMQDLLGFSNNNPNELDTIKNLFVQQFNIFVEKMLPIMANIIIWKRKGINTANYRNIKIENLFKVTDGKLHLKLSESEIVKKAFEQSNVNYTEFSRTETNNVIQEIQRKGLSYIITRGKYITSFFLMFCNSIEKECGHIGIKKTCKSKGTLGQNDVMTMIAPRAKKPQSLLNFIDNTIVKYLNNMQVVTSIPVNP